MTGTWHRHANGCRITLIHQHEQATPDHEHNQTFLGPSGPPIGLLSSEPLRWAEGWEVGP